MKKFLRNNGLSLVLAGLFIVFWAGQAISGWHVQNEDRLRFGKAATSFSDYLWSGHFWQSTGENWESEFLQMGFYVILTSFLYQKGSAESKDPDESETDKIPASHRSVSFLYRNSLSLAFLLLFVMAFGIHAAGGFIEENENRSEHQLPAQSLSEFITSSQFWFQSFQNWQSEFLAVLSIVILSIFLRQKGSPESKAIGQPNSKTGK